ncbi:Uncharacterised protein [Klebsiella pneumoniae]|nr:Uncharacterised protein [Klebsiella pneumoniae]
MEVIEGDFFYRVGQVDPGCTDIGRVHIHRQGFDGFNLAVTQVSEVTRQTFNTAIIPEFQRLALCIRDDGDVLMSLFEGDLINTE